MAILIRIKSQKLNIDVVNENLEKTGGVPYSKTIRQTRKDENNEEF